jgi:hypothetical protein
MSHRPADHRRRRRPTCVPARSLTALDFQLAMNSPPIQRRERDAERQPGVEVRLIGYGSEVIRGRLDRVALTERFHRSRQLEERLTRGRQPQVLPGDDIDRLVQIVFIRREHAAVWHLYEREFSKFAEGAGLSGPIRMLLVENTNYEREKRRKGSSRPLASSYHDSLLPAHMRRLGGGSGYKHQIRRPATVLEGSGPPSCSRTRAGELLLDEVSELTTHNRVIISTDGELHSVPFEVLVTAAGERLVQSHVVSYVPSGSVLVILRSQEPMARPRQIALAVSASPEASRAAQPASASSSGLGSISRGIYDLDATQLAPLPSANDEARAVVTTLGAGRSTLLIGDSATEREVKRQTLNDYSVLHFAAHGIVSTKYPARSALVLRPAGPDDGLVQAREILDWRLAADLVTLSACDTGAGTVHGQEGVASLVRPFLTAGARSVVANLWTADDRFSLALMREFYRHLRSGADVAQALRRSKLRMLEQFGPKAVPRLWSGVLVYGDGAATLTRWTAAAQTGGTGAPHK